MATTKTELPGGITEAQAKKLLEELAADPTSAGSKPRTLTPRERVVASLLRERDHLDGCPVIDDETASAQVEAFEERSPAPGPQLRNMGAGPGSPVVVVRCMSCAGSRYFVSELAPHVPTGQGRHVSALIARTLTPEPAAGELDTSL